MIRKEHSVSETTTAIAFLPAFPPFVTICHRLTEARFSGTMEIRVRTSEISCMSNTNIYFVACLLRYGRCGIVAMARLIAMFKQLDSNLELDG